MQEIGNTIQYVVIKTNLFNLLRHNKGFNGEFDVGIFLMVGEGTNAYGDYYLVTKPNTEVDENFKYPYEQEIISVPKSIWKHQVQLMLVFNINNN